MQKIFTPRLIVLLIVTVVCVYLTYPTLIYFYHVNRMDSPPTAEQVQKRNEMLEGKRLVKLGLDLQGGADFLITVETDLLQKRDMENEAERLRASFEREQVDAAVRIDSENAEGPRLIVTLNDQADLDYATTVLTPILEGDPTFEAVGDVREQLATDSGLILLPNQQMFDRKVAEAMDGALRVVGKRVDEFGLTNPIVKRSGRERIRVQIPGENNPERIRRSLLKTAALEFRLLHPEHDRQIAPFIEGGFLEGAGTGRVKPDLLEEVIAEETGAKSVRLKKDIPGVPAGYTLRLGRQPQTDPSTGLIDPKREIKDLVYMVESQTPLTGDNLRRAAVYTDPTSISDPIKVSIEFDGTGAKIFCQITEENVNRRFAIILDDQVYSAPNINEPICNGSAVITGGFSQSEAYDLSTVLRAGALPAPLKVISENTIGPSLGADSIRDSGKAIMIGGVLIVIMMVAIYGSCGVIAVLAMTLNVMLILAVLSLMGATLTLSGIGGILLTMGMAVDANILIYERLREELKLGKPLRVAINTAFERAYVVIFDSNITSLLPALVLVLFEVVEGTAMKGFWTAIAIGLLANLYTGVVATRTLAETWYAKFKNLGTGKLHLLNNVKFPWMKYRVVGIIFSLGLTLASIGYLAIVGPSYGIDFTGGVLTIVEIQDETVVQSQVKKVVENDFTDARVIRVVGKDQWQITVPQLPDKTGTTPSLPEIREKVAQSVQKEFGEKATILSSDSVAPDVGGEFKAVAIISMIITCAVILTYIAFRFQWIFGAGAVLALIHDVFLALGVFKMLGHSLTLDIVSALLIILGYSVNDTIVVFDRIREKMHEHLTADLGDLFNTAINETLSRTLLTGGSTLLAIAVMYLFGGVGLQDFALILLLGVGFGTYSSIFVASALVYAYLRKRGITTVIQARKATTRVAAPKTRNNQPAAQG